MASRRSRQNGCATQDFLHALPPRRPPEYRGATLAFFLLHGSLCNFSITEHDFMSVCHEVAHSLLKLRKYIVSD